MSSFVFLLESHTCCIGLLLCALASLDLQRWKQTISDPTLSYFDETTSWRMFAERIKKCVSNSYVSLSCLMDPVQVPKAIGDEQATSFIERLNSHSHDQLSFLLRDSMYQDPQHFMSSFKVKLKKNLQRLHFLFRVDDNGSGRSIISQLGQNWGYLSFSADFTSIQFSSFHEGNLPANLLKYVLPIFEAVAEFKGAKMAKYPPKPSIIQFQMHTTENGKIGKRNSFKWRGA